MKEFHLLFSTSHLPKIMWLNDSSSVGPFATRSRLHCGVLQAPHAKRRMTSCWDAVRCEVPQQGCFTGYLHSRHPRQHITPAARLHPRGVKHPCLPPSLPRQWWDFGHSRVAHGLFPVPCKGKNHGTESRASFCLPPPSSL